jgi:hypothetical protein
MYILSHIIKWLKANPIRIGVCLAHGWLLMFLTFSWVNQSFTLGKELSLIQITSGIRHLLFTTEAKPEIEDFLFVNTAYDRKLIEKYDNNVPLGNEDITDREKLARFFRILNQHPDSYQFVLCDIFFRDPSPDDALLAAEMSKMKNILIPYSKTSSDEWETLIFDDVPKGIVDYTTGDAKGTFLKFRLTETDKNIMHKSIPLLMYEKLYGAEFRKWGFLYFSFYFMNGKLSLNAMVPNFRIRNSEINDNNCLKLWEVLGLKNPEMLNLTKNRIIVIGDFGDRDMHETVFGNMPGPLLLVNAYLSIVKGDNLISPFFLICLFAVYTTISYKLFYGKRLETDQKDIRSVRRFFLFIGKPMSYGLMLGFVSVILYLIFNVHINILLVAVYLSFIDYVASVRKFNIKIVQKPRIENER